MVTATILDVARRLAWHGFLRASPRLSGVVSVALCLLAYAFKVSFTIADAPELLAAIPPGIWKPLEGVPLIIQARTVFAGITLIMLFNLYQSLYWKLNLSEPSMST